ncbi:biotin transporter BioY [Wolbachia pipientis]|uniref:Biotin transporter n=1 Tax=Wolbachia pipientis TaxID=955 RepID=A0A1E7QJY8_WOLPI|nr:biotin transporter BioY [Wolbachia pipientis]OEY86707.1 biotin transporter BioY [Wolbachia pipientis]
MFVQSYSKVNQLIELLFCVLLLFLMSQINIPLKPVPMTLQSVAIMVIGLKFSSKIAVNAILTYLLLGVCGMPVFAGFSSGYRVLYGPSCGYFVGFIVAVITMNYVKLSRYQLFVRDILSCLAGTVIIYICGVSWLIVGMGIDIEQAVRVGVMPFIIPGIVKAFILVIILNYLDSYRKC